jgi:hypothetical protein
MGARAASSWPIRRGLRAPPPETISWAVFVCGKTKRFKASTTLRAVKMVAVRIRSSGRASSLRPSVRISSTNVRPKYSRPVDFGGLRRRYGSARSFSRRETRQSPREAMRAPASKTGVEGQDVLWLGVGGDYGDVGDAAQIEGDAA